MNEIDIISPCFGGQFIVDRSIALVIGSLPILFGVGSFISQWENYKQMLLFVVIGLLCGFLVTIGRAIFITYQYESIDFRELKLYNFFGYGVLLGVAVNCLLSKAPLNGESLVLTGAEAITNKDMAQRFSCVTNSTIEYINLSQDELLTQLERRSKLPNWLANHIVELDDLAVKVLEPTTSSIEKILNRKPRIMDAYLQEYRHLYTSKPLWKFWAK